MAAITEIEEVEAFLKVARLIAIQTANETPKKVTDSLKYLVDRAAGFDGASIKSLSEHLTRKAPAKPRAGSASKSSGTVYFSESDLQGVVSLLEVASTDAYRFKDVVEQYNKDLSAAAMKAVAAAFARSPKPKTKADAVRLLVAARNERERANHKAKESETTKPW